jgi:hypothetical protein
MNLVVPTITVLLDDNWCEIIQYLSDDAQIVYNLSCVTYSIERVFISDEAKSLVVSSDYYISDEAFYFFQRLEVQTQLVEEIEKNNDGGYRTFCNGKLHCLRGQSSVRSSRINPEVQMWHNYGELHRLLKPALINTRTKVKEWRWKGLLHNPNGPAMIINGSYQEWRMKGVLTRPEEEGPAICDQANGIKKYYLDGVLTRSRNGNIVEVFANGILQLKFEITGWHSRIVLYDINNLEK